MSQGEGGGRPIKYTPERLAAILHDIGNRIPYELAAEANGIREATLYAWILQGNEEQEQGLNTPLARFSEDLKKTEREKINYHLNKMKDNVERWQADAWILERRWYKYFGANVGMKDLDERIKNIENKRIKDDVHE